MFELFPKTRPPLPEEIQEIYTAHYGANRSGATAASSLSRVMEAWMHRRVARDVTAPHDPLKATLELGAGTLNQLRYEPPTPVYDIVEPFTALFESSPLLGRVRTTYRDITDVPSSERYQRVTSVAVLEHLCDLPRVVARSGALLAEGGVFKAGVPSEGGLLWTLGWKITTGLEFRFRYGLDYGALMRHEHVNTAAEIEEVLRHFFSRLSCEVLGISRSLSLYRYYECREPRLDRCQAFLRGGP